MPFYGVLQTGGVLTCVNPGDTYTLLNGTETYGSLPQASVAFSRGVGEGLQPSGIVFTISYPTTPTAVIEIQGSNQDIAATYQTLYTSNNLQNDYYADAGLFAFYRAVLVSQSAGGSPTVIAQR